MSRNATDKQLTFPFAVMLLLFIADVKTLKPPPMRLLFSGSEAGEWGSLG
jgi:hypothetical protein